jgi:hypothetical protein
MNRRHWFGLAGALALGLVGLVGGRADAGFEQSYSGWHKSPYSYYYRVYHSRPSSYDYVILYPTQPRYLYYYNPAAKQYWGRFDLKAKGYSLLAEADRKGLLKDIPESSFPEPGDLPQVPGGEEGEKVKSPPEDLPTDLPVGEDVTAKTDPKPETKADPDPGKPGKPADPVTPDAPTPGSGGAVTPTGGGTTVDAPKPPANPGTTPPAPGGGTAAPDAGAPPVKLPPGKDDCDKNCPKKP